MMKPHMLAASTRPIADVLVDSLRTSAKFARLRATLPEEENHAYEKRQFDLQLEDDSAEKDSGHGARQILHPGDAAAAILLGQAFERSRDVLADLTHSETLAILIVPHLDFVEPISKVLRKHVLGPGTSVISGDSLTKPVNLASPGTVVIFDSSEEATRRKHRPGGAEFAAAVQMRCAIIGVTSDLCTLPLELVNLVDHRIVVPPLDGAAVNAVIEAVTGSRPTNQIDQSLASRVTLEALSIAVRADLGPERSLARLRRLLDSHGQSADGPLLSQMHGLGPAKQWGLDLAADLRAYAAHKLPWAACAKGLLVSGPPGTGKTSYARALSREAGVHFTATSYAAWQSQKDGNLGAVTAAIRKIFADAAKPGIIFIDEIDTLPSRGQGGRNDLWFTAIVNCLLEQLDGFERREGIVVVAACNDPSRLDPALVRAGRLDHHIEIPLPDVPALLGIFRTHLGEDIPDADLRGAALAARGHTGADVERWVRMARRTARTAGQPLKLQDLIDSVRQGEPEWPADVRRRIAYHEAGHAIAQLALAVAKPTALSIGGAGGLAESAKGEMQAETREHLEKFLVVLLSGRAAEQLIFAEATAGAGGSGANSDLARATHLATRLETDFGFGSFGLVSLAGDVNNRDLLMFEKLRAAVGSTVDRAYAMALNMLDRNRSTLDALAAALFAAGYLDRAEIDAVLHQTPLCPLVVTEASAYPTANLESRPVDEPIDNVETQRNRSVAPAAPPNE
jgi:cell division protease FtsH